MQKEHETWQEALERFNKLMKDKNRHEIEYNGKKIPYSRVRYETNVVAEDALEMEKLLQLSLPEDLKEFYSKYNTITVLSGLRNYFSISPLFHETETVKKPFPGLLNSITRMGDCLESDLKDELDPEIHDSLNEKYKVFGWYDPNISGCDVIFWFFDKNGKYGTQEFYHDDYDEWAPKLNKADLITVFSLDQLISQAVDQALKDFEEDEEY